MSDIAATPLAAPPRPTHAGLFMLYSHFGDLDPLRRTLGGTAAAAVGLMISTFAKMATPLFRSFGPAPLVLLTIAAAIGVSIIALLSFPARESATLTTVPRAPAPTV